MKTQWDFHPETSWIFYDHVILNGHVILDGHVMGQPITGQEMGEILSNVSNNSPCLSKNTFSVNVTQWSNLSTHRHQKIIEHWFRCPFLTWSWFIIMTHSWEECWFCILSGKTRKTKYFEISLECDKKVKILWESIQAS